MKREIRRIVFLQEYRNRPEELIELVPEVVGKGYNLIGVSCRIGQEDRLIDLAKCANEYGMKLAVFTGFMKYQQAWLKEHPEQRMVLNSELDAVDQDRLIVNWGCPFNPEFQKRYFDFLRFIGQIENVEEVWVNDEASLGFSADKLGCYCKVCCEEWEREFGYPLPVPPFKDKAEHAKFVYWRIRRWNDVHKKMKNVLNEHHPIRTIFLVDPITCLFKSPAISAVDIPTMVESIDGVMTDPYYTFHLSNGSEGFDPREVYLSENCRFLRGMVGENKEAGICTQGFSHPTFIRPLDERDGFWSAIIPASLGINGITSYTYLLQKISPVQKSYEYSFKLDKYFENTEPVKFIALIDSFETQCFSDRWLKDNWRMECLFPSAELCRFNGLPYTYYPTHRLSLEELRQYPVIFLSEVSCLSELQREVLLKYAEAGGLIVGFGRVGLENEKGEYIGNEFLQKLFGVSIKDNLSYDEYAEFSICGDYSKTVWEQFDEKTLGYNNGVCRPAIGVKYPIIVDACGKTNVLGFFESKDIKGKPAVIHYKVSKGDCIYFAGLASRIYLRKEYQTWVQNLLYRFIGKLLLDLRGDALPIRAVNFPPAVPMKEIRPLDRRYAPTMEFIVSGGENYYVVVIPSYFKEPFTIEMEAKIPVGKTLKKIIDGLTEEPVREYSILDNTICLSVSFGFDDYIKVVIFVFESKEVS